MAAEKTYDILLFGLGGIGSFYSFILSRSSNVRLTVAARSNYEAVKSKGLLLKSQNHGEHLIKPYKVVKTPAEAGQTFDYVVCCHKGIQQDQTPQQISAAIDPAKTTIVIIQNGVGNEEPFRKAFPESSILSCVTWVGAKQPEPGVVHHSGGEDMQIGIFPNDKVDPQLEQQRLNEFADLLTHGKTVFQVVPNIQVQRWEKVVWNAAWNPLTTLTMLDTKTWLESPDAMMLTRRLMREVIDVARACEVPIEYGFIDELIERVQKLGGIGSSMQMDYKNGKPMEVDIILGYVVTKARELNLPIPTVETLYVMLTAMNGQLLKSGA